MAGASHAEQQQRIHAAAFLRTKTARLPSMPLPGDGNRSTGSRTWKVWVVGAIRLTGMAVHLRAFHVR